MNKQTLLTSVITRKQIFFTLLIIVGVCLLVLSACRFHSKSERSIEGLLSEIGETKYHEIRTEYAVDNMFQLQEGDYVKEFQIEGYMFEAYLGYTDEAYCFAARTKEKNELAGLLVHKQLGTILKEYKYRQSDAWETVCCHGLHEGGFIAEQANGEKKRIGVLNEDGTFSSILQYDDENTDSSGNRIRPCEIVGSKLLFEERAEAVSLKAVDTVTHEVDLIRTEMHNSVSYMVSSSDQKPAEGALYSVLTEGDAVRGADGMLEQEEQSELFYYSFIEKKSYPVLLSCGKHLHDQNKDVSTHMGDLPWERAMGDTAMVILYGQRDLFSAVSVIENKGMILDRYGEYPRLGDFTENELRSVRRLDQERYIITTKWKIIKTERNNCNYASYMIAAEDKCGEPYLRPEPADDKGKYVLVLKRDRGTAYLYNLDQGKKRGTASSDPEVRWRNRGTEALQQRIDELYEKRAYLLLRLQAESASENEAGSETIRAAVDAVDRELEGLGVVFDREPGEKEELLISPGGLNIVSCRTITEGEERLESCSGLLSFILSYFSHQVQGTVSPGEASEKVIEKWSDVFEPKFFRELDSPFVSGSFVNAGTGQACYYCACYPERVLELEDDHCIVEFVAVGFRHLLEIRKQSGQWMVTEDLRGLVLQDQSYSGADHERAMELYHQVAMKHVARVTEADVEKAMDRIRGGVNNNWMYGGIIGAPGETHEDGRRNLIADPYSEEENIRNIEKYLSIGGQIPPGMAIVSVNVREEAKPFCDIRYGLLAVFEENDWKFAGNWSQAFSGTDR